jgi:hypothetical protein
MSSLEAVSSDTAKKVPSIDDSDGTFNVLVLPLADIFPRLQTPTQAAGGALSLMRTVVPRPDSSMKILAPVEMLAVRLAAPVASGWLALGFTPARYVSIHYRSTHERDGASDPVRIASIGVVDLIEIKAIAALPSLFALQALMQCGMAP